MREMLKMSILKKVDQVAMQEVMKQKRKISFLKNKGLSD